MDEKANRRPRAGKIYYQISEVAQLTGVNESTLRNWEEQYEELRNIRRINNRRHYTASDIATIERISAKRLNKDSKEKVPDAEGSITENPKSDGNTPKMSNRGQMSPKQVRELVKSLKEVKNEIQKVASQLERDRSF